MLLTRLLGFLFVAGLARGDELASLARPELSPEPPAPAPTKFLKISGTPEPLRWQSRFEFHVSEDSYQLLSAAMKTGPLFLRVYAGTSDVLSRRQSGGDPIYHCIRFFYLTRPQIRLVGARGARLVVTEEKVDRWWFDEPRDMSLTVVVDAGKLPEEYTRIHHTLVADYFNSGMAIPILAKNAEGQTVDMGWKGPVGERSNARALPGVAAERPSSRETSYIGDLTSLTKDMIQFRIIDSHKFEQVKLAGRTVNMYDQGIKVGERVLVIEIEEGGVTRVSVRRSFYPECILPENQTTNREAGPIILAIVQRCKTGLPSLSAQLE